MVERLAMMRGILTVLLVGTFAVGVGGCTGPGATTTPAVSPGTSGSASPSVPAGFTVREGDGFSVAVPSEWTDIPAGSRSYPQAAMEIGIPFTGQAVLQPRLTVWVDRSANLGEAKSQAELTQVKVRSDVPGAKVGDLHDATVTGAVSAVWFEYSYHMDTATSVLDTKIEAADYRVRDLTVQVDGTPQFGFRYSASAKDFSDASWQSMLASIAVRADK